jgi:hypothetical protein
MGACVDGRLQLQMSMLAAQVVDFATKFSD